jgi:hypothetical protein
MIGQRAYALFVGDAKQRSALYAFLRSSILVASSVAPFEPLRAMHAPRVESELSTLS